MLQNFEYTVSSAGAHQKVFARFYSSVRKRFSFYLHSVLTLSSYSCFEMFNPLTPGPYHFYNLMVRLDIENGKICCSENKYTDLHLPTISFRFVKLSENNLLNLPETERKSFINKMLFGNIPMLIINTEQSQITAYS